MLQFLFFSSLPAAFICNTLIKNTLAALPAPGGFEAVKTMSPLTF